LSIEEVVAMWTAIVVESIVEETIKQPMQLVEYLEMLEIIVDFVVAVDATIVDDVVVVSMKSAVLSE
jgi:hypothetical protein